jgi:hypothetical protein
MRFVIGEPEQREILFDLIGGIVWRKAWDSVPWEQYLASCSPQNSQVDGPYSSGIAIAMRCIRCTRLK